MEKQNNFFQKIWQLWKKFGQVVGDIVGRVILTVFYFTVFLPFGLGVRLLSDPLDIGSRRGAVWIDRTTTDLSLSDTRRMH
ncbi:MAG: hypothetical protein EHM41_09280 [Chloroflexi bacterium]|nr:MAG: hypothetical protein EHM41_09280 [Chloroflexota bacterium]